MSDRNITALLLCLVITVVSSPVGAAVSSLSKTSSPVTVDWTEGFEYASKSAQEAVWPSSCPNSPTLMFSSTERPRTGSRSLKMQYSGHQAFKGEPATPGYMSCYMTRNLIAPSETVFTRWYMYAENFTYDYVSTKVTRVEKLGVLPGVWWVFLFGTPRLSANVEGIVNDAGQIATENVQGGAFPQNQWVCVETQLSMSTPGVDDGIVRQWINGTQTLNKTNQRMRPAITVDRNGPNSSFETIKIYIQDGVGVIYLDDYAVSRTARIGCSSSTSTTSDTTRPAPPQELVIK